MGRVPFYAYPNAPYSFYPSSAEAYFHRPHRPFSPPFSSSPQPAPTSHSVINVPVHDSPPSRPSSSAPQSPPAAVPLVDPSSAATTIQSHFRGFCVRRHHPLLHLRSIARAWKQLEELQSELEMPEFSLKVRASEKERLRFSESVMAIILRLDAIEGSIAEVRSQRKEATKMAIKLQDAIDAIMMQKDEIVALDSTADKGGMGLSHDVVVIEQPQEALHPEVDMVDMVQGDGSAVPANANMDGNTLLEEKHLFSEDNVADTCMPNINNNGVMDMGIAEDNSSLHPYEMDGLAEQREAGSGCIESVSQGQDAKAMCETEQDISLLMGETSGSDETLGNIVATHAAEEEVGNGIDALHVETHENHMQNAFLGTKVDQDTHVDDTVDAVDGSAKRESTDGSCTCMDVAQEGINQAVEICPGTPTAEENCDHPHCGDPAHGNECQGPLPSLDERPTEGNCSSDGHSSPELHRHGYEECGHEANSITDEINARARTLSMVETPSAPQDNAILQQLSEDCTQVKSLVGKLLVQNKAQSNILCVLAERLEMLEHRQQHACQHDRQKMREKKKLKKGSKRSVKHRNCEE